MHHHHHHQKEGDSFWSKVHNTRPCIDL
jgi:hypothetical protein